MCEAVVILGPTASGKSALALDVARHYRSEIISLDSALIYKGMDIGTAKPTPEELSTCPHHLIDICEPSDTYSAANFRSDCIRLVEEIRGRGALPIICGGTMMYYKALVNGLSPVPASTPEVRAKVAAIGQEHGWPYVHELLKGVDPKSYERLNANDKQRVARALEVYYLTGKPLSSFMVPDQDQCPFSRLEFVLLPQNQDRTKLREQIRARFEKMITDGLIDEVKALVTGCKVPPIDSDEIMALPSMRSVGYRQTLMYLRGEVSLEEMIELSVIATARLAKHQMTWLRGGLSEERASSGNTNCDEAPVLEASYAQRHCVEIENSNKLQQVLALMGEHEALASYKIAD